MTAKEYLRQLYFIDARINSKIRLRDHYKYMAGGGTSGVSALRDSGTSNHSKVEDYVIKMVDLEREIDAEVDALVDLRREAVALIALINDDRYRTILTMRYIDMAMWEFIGEAIHYNKRQAQRLHGKALLAFQTVMPDSVKRCHEMSL